MPNPAESGIMEREPESVQRQEQEEPMNIEHLKENGLDIAVVSGDETIISDVQSALDLMMTVRYDTGADRIAIDKACIAEDFFILSTGLAGEILQKFINYRVKAAIWGTTPGTPASPCGTLSTSQTTGGISSSRRTGRRPSGGWRRRSNKPLCGFHSIGRPSIGTAAPSVSPRPGPAPPPAPGSPGPGGRRSPG